MSEIPLFCELILSRKLADSEIKYVLESVLHTEVSNLNVSADEEINYMYRNTDDDIFPLILDVYGGRKNNRLSLYQGVDLAQRLFEKHQINALTDPLDLVSGLAPDDPYWYLLLEDGRWFLADSSGSRLEDPQWPSGVRKEAEIEFDRLMRKEYHWDETKKKLICQPGSPYNSGQSLRD